MRRLFIGPMAILLGLGFFLAQPARAYILAVIPMKDVLQRTQFIFTAKVQTFDADKGQVVFKVDENLKGKVPFETMNLPLVDRPGVPEWKRPSLLVKRLGPGLSVVCFADLGASKAFDKVRSEGMTLFMYTNGNWSQIAGTTNTDGQTKIQLRFHHFEPYLRRTFKGTTAEMRQVVIDGLSGKKAPPAPDPKEPEGLGPEVKR